MSTMILTQKSQHGAAGETVSVPWAKGKQLRAAGLAIYPHEQVAAHLPPVAAIAVAAVQPEIQLPPVQPISMIEEPVSAPPDFLAERKAESAKKKTKE